MITNLFRRLKQLVPDAPLLIGGVVQVTDYGATIELVDGSHISARGSAEVGQKIFVKDGKIEGLAPTLPLFEIEI